MFLIVSVVAAALGKLVGVKGCRICLARNVAEPEKRKRKSLDCGEDES